MQLLPRSFLRYRTKDRRHSIFHPTQTSAIPSSFFHQTKRTKASYPFAIELDPQDEIISFDDTKRAFARKSISELIFASSILRLCAFDSLVAWGPKLLGAMEKLGVAAPAYTFIKHTFFRHFCAGETSKEAIKLVEDLKKDSIKVLLAYSIEIDGCKFSLDEVVDKCVEDIEVCYYTDNVPFSAIKVTGMVPNAHLLKKLNRLLEYSASHPTFTLPLCEALQHCDVSNVTGKGVFSKAIRALGATKSNMDHYPSDAPIPFDSQDLNDFADLMDRLETICNQGYKFHFPIVVDAEQTYYQSALDYLVMVLARRYCRDRPLIYQTYQMYRRDSLDRLKHDIATAKEENFNLGVKLVRGAYMEQERELATRKGYPDPIHPTLEDTHKAYNDAATIMCKEISTSDRFRLFIASHNEESAIHVIEEMKRENIPLHTPRVHFGQLYGMCDHVSYSLADMGVNVVKYIPYGPVKRVIPYLLRRMRENRGFIGRTAKERALMWSEVKRRLGL